MKKTIDQQSHIINEQRYFHASRNNVQESNHEPYSACTNVSLPFGNLILCGSSGILIQWARLRPRCAQPGALQPSHSLLPGPESAGSGRALSDSGAESELSSLRVTVTVTASATEAWQGPPRARLWRNRFVRTETPTH